MFIKLEGLNWNIFWPLGSRWDHLGSIFRYIISPSQFNPSLVIKICCPSSDEA